MMALGEPVYVKEGVFRTAVEAMSEGAYIVDRERKIRYWSAGAGRISGFAAEEVVGHFCHDNILRHVDETGRQLCFDGCPLLEAMEVGVARAGRVYLHHRDGHRVAVSVQALPLRGEDGTITGAIEVFEDRTEHLASLEQIELLRSQALIDPLTQIGNRRYSLITLQLRLSELARYGWQFGVLLADIDRFKALNDRHGHEAGDTALRTVAATLAGNLRTTDFVGRWGGEEFLVILASLQGPDQLLEIAERLCHLVAASADRSEARLRRITASFGATLARPEDTPESLVDRADQLMYESKHAGRNRVTLDPRA